MLSARIIPCLDISGGRVVKGTCFKDLRDMGDPVCLASRYETEGADEITVLDISSGIRKIDPDLATIGKLRKALGIPLCFGGGIRCLDDAARALDRGADKVSVNSAAVRNPSLVESIASRYGSQCCVVAMDVIRGKNGPKPSWSIVVDAGTRETGMDALAWARQAADSGAGELLITSRDRDGTGTGYDLGILKEISDAVGIPLIASGGAKKPDDFLEALRSGASALLAAGIFHRGELSIEALKRFLKNNAMEVRI